MQPGTARCAGLGMLSGWGQADRHCLYCSAQAQGRVLPWAAYAIHPQQQQCGSGLVIGGHANVDTVQHELNPECLLRADAAVLCSAQPKPLEFNRSALLGGCLPACLPACLQHSHILSAQLPLQQPLAALQKEPSGLGPVGCRGRGNSMRQV